LPLIITSPPIGLSIVKKLVELHNGNIDCKSKKNQGTSITCFIPYLAGDEEKVKKEVVIPPFAELKMPEPQPVPTPPFWGRRVLQKADFWDRHKETLLNGRQRLMLNILLEGFDGKLRTSKWAKITKCSADTALRDIKDLIEKGILRQEKSGGRSTNYELID